MGLAGGRQLSIVHDFHRHLSSGRQAADSLHALGTRRARARRPAVVVLRRQRRIERGPGARGRDFAFRRVTRSCARIRTRTTGTASSSRKAEPDGKAPAARFGVYRFAPGIWWWRLEVTVPRRMAEVPSPTDAGPVVFVLDASRSQERRGGLAPQLAIVEAYLANAPGAEVELVMTSRTAAVVFGRFVPPRRSPRRYRPTCRSAPSATVRFWIAARRSPPRPCAMSESRGESS